MDFDLPLRIHWRPGNRVDRDLAAAVRAVSPLALTVEIGDLSDLHPLDLPWTGTSLVIVDRGWRHRDSVVLPRVARRWEFAIDGPEDARFLAGESFLGLPPGETAFRWFPRMGGVADLIPIMETVAATGSGLTLPNRPAGVITGEGIDSFPGPGELSDGILERLRPFGGLFQSDRVLIHDFILTRSLELDVVESRGCEAANSLAFIDEHGTIFPCETLLVPLGTLDRDGLEGTWRSPIRKRIRKDVATVPGLCSSCPDLGLCRGGCRGAVYHLAGHYGAPDPLCLIPLDDRNE